MGGVGGGEGAADGGGSPRSNQEGLSARWSHSGVGGGVGIGFHGSCTRFRGLSVIDFRWNGADRGGGGVSREDPPVRQRGRGRGRGERARRLEKVVVVGSRVLSVPLDACCGRGCC